MSAFGRCLCISLTAPLYYQTIVAFLCGVFEQFANRFSGVFKGPQLTGMVGRKFSLTGRQGVSPRMSWGWGPSLPGRRARSFSEDRPLGWALAYRGGEPRVFPDRTAGSFSANVLGVGPQRVSVGAGLESRAVRGESSLLACIHAFTAPRKIPWRCRRCVWRPWRTSPRRSSRHIPGSARHRPP